MQYMRAVGAPFTSGIQARPLFACLRQHVYSRPNHSNYAEFGFRAHPPNPPPGGFLALCIPSRLYIDMTTSHSKPQLRRSVSGCGSSRPVPAARRQANVSKKTAPYALPLAGLAGLANGEVVYEKRSF